MKKLVQEIINIPKSISMVNDKVQLEIYAKPGAKRNHIVSITDDEISIQISAPPRDGEANTELRSYLASVLQLKNSQVSFARGQKSRTKYLIIEGKTIDEIYTLILNESKLE